MIALSDAVPVRLVGFELGGALALGIEARRAFFGVVREADHGSSLKAERWLDVLGTLIRQVPADRAMLHPRLPAAVRLLRAHQELARLIAEQAQASSVQEIAADAARPETVSEAAARILVDCAIRDVKNDVIRYRLHIQPRR